VELNLQIEKYLNIPYLPDGCDFDGTDCYGIIRLIYRNELSCSLPPFASSTEDSLINQLVEQNICLTETLQNPEPYCIVTFRENNLVSHMGMVLNDTRYFIHNSAKRQRSTRERLDHPYWSQHIGNFLRWKMH